MSKKRIALIVISVLLVVGGGIAWYFYQKIYAPNIKTPNGKEAFVFIHSGDDYHNVLANLSPFLKDVDAFEWTAARKDYNDSSIKPGRYRLTDGMANNTLINMLRGGLQAPVRVTFNNVRLKTDLAGKIGKYLEIDSIGIINLLNDRSTAKNYGFNDTTFMAMFIPDTYEFKWTTTAQQFVERMKKEYDKFWTDERKKLAGELKLSPTQVSTLASIVQSETNMADERKRIAGVYINRLNVGMPLQADPTLKFAVGDFTLKRILNKHMEVESPYNTYKYAGLPPGPICLPDAPCIDAVLNYERHDYLYFCAKEDFSGYSNFAVTYQQHLQNAQKYQSALNKRGIR